MNLGSGTRLRLAQLQMCLKAITYGLMACYRKLPGRRFEQYGRRLALRGGATSNNRMSLLINPVSSVRYFEFDYASRQIPAVNDQLVLDAASPNLFGFYLSEHLQCDYKYINLDEREITHLRRMLPAVRVRGQYEAQVGDVVHMADDSESYDVVISISVIEHIPGDGDSRALLEMWRVLRPGGRLILTFPVSGIYEEEYREQDQYQVGLTKESKGYFFQRYYDEAAIKARLLDQLPNSAIEAMELYGEREAGWFRAYEQRWIARGLHETVKDPYLMARHMKRFDAISELPGMGIAGLCLGKRERMDQPFDST